tara:strand:- start:521 stop:790 length:270 start_codon:yes stop_codon:yes gene_type:complete
MILNKKELGTLIDNLTELNSVDCFQNTETDCMLLYNKMNKNYDLMKNKNYDFIDIYLTERTSELQNEEDTTEDLKEVSKEELIEEVKSR